ncbi:MAG TPA: isochorismatase family cysteine hydrolase [Pseudonocardia sp.]|nr:isochorismatase family cysteine hydrolase [Pseudonocardia sp.]
MEGAYGFSIPRTVQEACDPQRMALLVYDMQVGVLGQIDRGPEIIERVLQVIDAARTGGYRIIYLRHMFLPKEMAGVSALRTLMAWQRVQTVAEVQPMLLSGSPGFELVPELDPRPEELVLDKVTMSAFAGTPLDIVLRDCGMDSYAIVGVATEIGIEPTVRHSLDLGYLPVLVTDACGAGHEAAGQRALETLEFAGGSLQTDTATICGALSGTAG